MGTQSHIFVTRSPLESAKDYWGAVEITGTTKTMSQWLLLPLQLQLYPATPVRREKACGQNTQGTSSSLSSTKPMHPALHSLGPVLRVH